MTQTTIETSLAQLTSEYETKLAALLHMKQEQEAQARELAQLDANKAAASQAQAAALATQAREHNEVIAPSQAAFDTVGAKAAAWLARMAAAEAQLHELCKEQHELLSKYEAAAAHAGTRARVLSSAGQFHFFDNDLWPRAQLIPENWPREVGNYFAVWVNQKHIYTTLRNSYRRGITGN